MALNFEFSSKSAGLSKPLTSAYALPFRIDNTSIKFLCCCIEFDQLVYARSPCLSVGECK